jgi:hypothetical protein
MQTCLLRLIFFFSNSFRMLFSLEIISRKGIGLVHLFVLLQWTRILEAFFFLTARMLMWSGGFWGVFWMLVAAPNLFGKVLPGCMFSPLMEKSIICLCWLLFSGQCGIQGTRSPSRKKLWDPLLWLSFACVHFSVFGQVCTLYGGRGDQGGTQISWCLMGRASDLACFMANAASNASTASAPDRLMITEGWLVGCKKLIGLVSFWLCKKCLLVVLVYEFPFACCGSIFS